MMQASTQTEAAWHESMEEPLKRRRPFRKRKRRPLDSVPVERQVYPEQAPEIHEQEYRETTERPRRRRKKLDNRRTQWTEDYVEAERPFRKRNHRKKRPSLNEWRMSEYDDTPQESLDRPQGGDLYARSPISDDTKLKVIFQEKFHDRFLETRSGEPEKLSDPLHDDDVQLKEDKSLSEFSMEVPHNKNKQKDITNVKDDYHEYKSQILELSMANKLHEKAQHLELPERPILISSELINLPTKLKEKIVELNASAEELGSKMTIQNNQITATQSRVSMSFSVQSSSVVQYSLRSILQRNTYNTVRTMATDNERLDALIF